MRAWRSQRWHKSVVAASTLAVILYAGQVMAGAANIWTLMQPAAISAHVALAVGVWATLVAVALLAHRASLPAPVMDEWRTPQPVLGVARSAGDRGRQPSSMSPRSSQEPS